MSTGVPSWVNILMFFLEHSERIILVQTDEQGKIVNCNPALMRFMHRKDLPIGFFIQEILVTPTGDPINFCSEDSKTSPIPQVFKIKGSTVLFKVICWRYDNGMTILGECIGGDDSLAFQTMSYLTNELVKIGKELAKKNRELMEAKERIEALSRTDYLTGLANRRYFMERLEEAISLAHRHNLPLSLVMADLDHFKQVNDTQGHEAGDIVLKHFAETLINNCRKEDLPARIGGEEFAVLLPHTTENGAKQFALRICEIMRHSDFIGRGSPVTVSIGIATLLPEDDAKSLLRHADEALYKAKAQGRDCVVLYRPKNSS